MGKDLILLVVGGLAAGALFGSIVTGSLGAALLAYFAAAPLFLVGLSLGWLPAAAAALIGAATVAGIIGFFTAGYFALIVGLPVAVLCRQALLSRADGQGGVEWYPPGQLVAVLTAMAAAALAAMFTVALLQGIDPRLEVQQTIEAVLDAGLPPEVAERAREQGLAERAANFLPGIAAALLFLTLALDGVLAQAIAARLSIARRPSPVWRSLTLPAWPLYALGLSCLAGIAAGGALEYIGRNLAIVFAVPFLLQGLAVVHAAVARLPGRTVWLVGFYLLGLLMAWPFVLVAALGLAEPYVGLRARLGGRSEGELVMELVLLERVESLGLMGDIVTVKPGYARNYLLPQKKALRATPENMAVFEARRAELEARNLERKGEAEAVAGKLEGFSVTLIRRAGDTGHLYGSVTVRDIAEAASEIGVEIDRRQLRLPQPIKSLGLHDITVQLHPEVQVPITANVARTLDEAEAQARGEDVLAVDDEDAYRFEGGLSEFFDDGVPEGGGAEGGEAAPEEEPAEES